MYWRSSSIVEVERYVRRAPCSFSQRCRAYLGALTDFVMEKLRSKFNGFISRSCFSCFVKPHDVVTVDKPSKGLKIQGKVMKKANVSEEIWSTSTGVMESSGVQSQQTGNFPNKLRPAGLLLWNQARQQWVGAKRARKQTKTQKPGLCRNPTFESLLETNSRFQRPVPLSEVVDFLVEVWKKEGMSRNLFFLRKYTKEISDLKIGVQEQASPPKVQVFEFGFGLHAKRPRIGDIPSPVPSSNWGIPECV
ncbi:hypothetical protein AKJ16_DCAP21560 [Drosera capensis]